MPQGFSIPLLGRRRLRGGLRWVWGCGRRSWGDRAIELGRRQAPLVADADPLAAAEAHLHGGAGLQPGSPAGARQGVAGEASPQVHPGQACPPGGACYLVGRVETGAPARQVLGAAVGDGELGSEPVPPAGAAHHHTERGGGWSGWGRGFRARARGRGRGRSRSWGQQQIRRQRTLIADADPLTAVEAHLHGGARLQCGAPACAGKGVAGEAIAQLHAGVRHSPGGSGDAVGGVEGGAPAGQVLTTDIGDGELGGEALPPALAADRHADGGRRGLNHGGSGSVGESYERGPGPVHPSSAGNIGRE